MSLVDRNKANTLESRLLHDKFCKFEPTREVRHCNLIFIYDHIEFIWIDTENPPSDTIGWVAKK